MFSLKRQSRKFSARTALSWNNDFVYLWHMAKADYYKSSLPDEKSLALFVRDTIEDPDMLGSNCFRRWLADADATGLVIEWYDLL